MKQRSQNLAVKEIADLKADLDLSKSTFKNESAARRALKMLAPLIAPKIAVTSQRLNQWKNGEEISSERNHEILLAAKEVFIMDLNKLEDAIDQELLLAYGRADRGRF